MSEPNFRLEIHGGVAELVLDVPGRAVNVLTEDVLRELRERLAHLEELPAARTIVLRSGKEAGFCAGADVTRIAMVRDEATARALAEFGQETCNRLERCRKPVIAAVHGACVGGGLELVLACRRILASEEPRTQLGLPEVLLGIIPGFGGTQRLPRRVGLTRALDLILTGRRLRAKQALRAGLVDDVVCPYVLRDEARRVALALADGAAVPRRGRRPGLLDRIASSLKLLRRFVLARAKSAVKDRTRGLYPAPFEAIESIGRAYDTNRTAAYAEEAAAVGRLLARDESHALVDLFLATEEAKKLAGAAPGLRSGDLVAVIGGGVMGAGIARAALRKGAAVRLCEVSPDALRRGLAAVAEPLRRDERRGRLPRAERLRMIDRLSGTSRLDGLRAAALVVEAVVEREDVKADVFAKLAARVNPDALLCSNTSSLSVTAIGDAIGQPGAVIGMHFFNPVDKMPLVEIVTPRGGARSAIERAAAIARDLGKTPIAVADTPGFLVNRVLGPYLAEALLLLEEGLAPDTIDESMLALGFAMGPLAVLDAVGLDVATAAAAQLEACLGARIGRPEIGKVLVERGKLGDKTRGGIRLKPPRGASRAAPWLDAALDEARRRRGVVANPPPRQDGADRMFFTLLAEAAEALEEQVVGSAREVDLGLVLGAGFPPLRGGPMREIERRGRAVVAARLTDLALRYGSRFEPVPALRDGGNAGGSTLSR
jgi:3-hydroxyacyl-CoA dehydrogenase/enoyl-CoA hydratase/3-hydroxybutyryl-CoA epimerase